MYKTLREYDRNKWRVTDMRRYIAKHLGNKTLKSLDEELVILGMTDPIRIKKFCTEYKNFMYEWKL